MIGERWAKFFAEWPPINVSISLYGLSDESYERVTGIPNAFRKCERAFDLLDQYGVTYSLKCPAFALTIDEIPAMKEYADRRGVKFAFDPVIQPHERGSFAPVTMQLSPERIDELFKELDPDGEDWRSQIARGLEPNDGRMYRCGAGLFALHVTVRGDVTTCTTSRQPVGNIFRDGFDAVWAALGNKVSRKFPEGHPCATCRFRGVCFGCPATVEAVAGLPEGYVQQYCKITHLRMHAVGEHPTGVPRTVTEGIPAHVRVPGAAARRALPVLT
jgi:radical SAM protein with 4Fe4S-binding SPASM domain